MKTRWNINRSNKLRKASSPSLSKEQAIERAKLLVLRQGGTGAEKRKWLMGTDGASYETEIHVLEGTPARGYLVVVRYSGGGTVHAYGMYFHKKLGTFKFADENYTVLPGGCIMKNLS